MACLIVPAAEAVVTTIVGKVIKSKEKENESKLPLGEVSQGVDKIKFSTKLGWLNKMLWGGSGLLAFEHIWHGEITPSFPFLTAISNGETGEMLAEMGTAGVAMAVLVTGVWIGMVAVTSAMEKRENCEKKSLAEEL